MLKILRNLLGVLFSIAVIVLINVLLQYHQMNTRNEQIMQQVLVDEAEKETEQPKEAGYADAGDEDAEDAFLPQVDFKALKEINENAVGWIYACNGEISYPIVASTDEFYLKHAIDGTKSKSGAIFVNSEPDELFPGNRAVIYGHNMRDGSMFHALLQYWRDSAYPEKSPYVYIITEHETYCYEVASVYVAEYAEIVFEPNAEPEAAKVIDLITCEYSGENTRLVVEARQIENIN